MSQPGPEIDVRHDVALVRSLGHGEKEAHVVDRPRERPEVLDRVELGREEVERDAPEARLQPDEAAPRRGDPHRPAHVRPLPERDAARRAQVNTPLAGLVSR